MLDSAGFGGEFRVPIRIPVYVSRQPNLIAVSTTVCGKLIFNRASREEGRPAMQPNATQSPPDVALEDFAGTSGLVRHVDAVSHPRTIAVGDARTIVVRPRIPNWVQGLLGLSLGLNLLVLVLLLAFGMPAYRGYRSLAADLAPFTSSALVPKDATTAGQSPATRAVTTAGYTLGETLGAVQGLESATIRAQIPIDHQLPLQMQVPIDQSTTVVTTAPIPLNVPALITLPDGGGYVNATISMDIPPGTKLPVHLSLSAPIDTTVPLRLDVPVAIPVRDTELGGPLARLRTTLEPVVRMLSSNRGQR